MAEPEQGTPMDEGVSGGGSEDAERQEEGSPEPTRTAEEAKLAGNASFKAGKYADAVAAYTEAIALDGKQPAFYSNRAMTLIKMGKLSDAHADGLKATQIDPTFGKGFLRAAQASVKMGSFDSAIGLFAKALEADPALSSALKEKQAAEEAHRVATQVRPSQAL